MTKKDFFDPVDLKIDFPLQEQKLISRWYKNGVVRSYLQKNNNSKKYFSFLDGPITANNPMGVHHAWGRTYKDLWQRFKSMQGYKQRFQNGFDAQGLWVEVEVEKELGFKSKKDIEKYGVAKFVEKCKERVLKYSKIQTEQSKRLGYFMDWDHSYYTLSDDNNYLIWYFLKVCNQNGWLYKGSGSVPWCPRCETAISQHEILTEDYKELVHESIILKFPIEGRKDEFLLIWTTTPWTIPANIAVALDRDLDYSLVKDSLGNKYWLATETIKRVFGKEEKPVITVKGAKLVGLTYKGPFDDLPAVKEVWKMHSDKFHRVVVTDQRLLPVTTDEGTGLVHIAVSAGTEDYKLGQKLKLPMIPVIKDNATYFDGFGFLSGKNAKDNPRIILDYLENNDRKGHWAFDIFKYKHRYPVCWRCKEELVWKVTDEWYISMDKPSESKVKSKSKVENKTLRKKMMDVAKKIEWIPGFGLKRELDWLDNMQDWLISKKNRYWGLALPIWECKKCGNFEVIGSYEELKKKAYSGWSDFEGKSPHKPDIDKIKIKCTKCKEIINRIEPVGNPWLDAGIVAYSTISNNNRAANFTPTTTKPLYLTDKNSWRRWFPADFITEGFPGQFKNWFYSLITMSTVLENENPFKTVLGFATLLSEDGKPMHKSTGDMIEFNEAADKIGVDVMRWMYSRQNPSENLLFGYKLADETRRKFHLKLWNIYNFFVTYANLDKWVPTEKDLMYNRISTGYKNILDDWILTRLSQTISFTTKNLDNYDAFSASEVLQNFIDDMSNWYIRRSRERIGPSSESIKNRDSFYRTTYFVLVQTSKLLAPFIPYISDVIYINLTKEKSVHLSDWPKGYRVNNVNLLESMEVVRNIAEKVHSKRKKLGIPLRQPLSTLYLTTSQSRPDKITLQILREEINVKQVIWKIGKRNLIKLDTKITKGLQEEAQARELVRKIQDQRKKLGLNLKKETKVYSPWLPGDKKLLTWVKTKTMSKGIYKSKIFKVTT